MPFLAQEHHQIPNKDILSWMFDDITYDLDDPLYINAEHPEENRISARQAKRMIRQLVAGFRAIGVQKGDCVSIHSFNDIHYPLFFLAIVGAGAVFAATNPAYTPHELAHTLKTAQAKYVLTQETLLDSALEAAKEVGIADQNVIIFNPTGPPTNSNRSQWSDLLQHGEEDWIRFDDYETSSNTTAAFLFSSGTTGLPKAVCLSHYNFIAEIALLFEAHPRPWRIHYLFALPMFHAATSFTAFCLIIRLGAKGFVFPRFDLEKWFWAIQEYAITDLAIVPPIAVMAVNSALNRKYSMQSVRLAWAGAAPIDAALQARMQALIPNASLTQVYGMTESSCVAFTHRWPETDTTGSIGYPLPNMDCKLVDDDGKDISGYDVRGEICMRGALVTKGYFQNSEANARDWDEEGYFHTGDIAFVDGKTKLWYIVDRKKVGHDLRISKQWTLTFSITGTHQSPRLPGFSR